MGLLGASTNVDTRIGRTTGNALTLTYRAGPGDPLATAKQGATSGRAKVGILFGFKNGGSGLHVISDGTGQATLEVHCIANEPTVVRAAGSGATIGTIERGDQATVRDAAGEVLATLTDDPDHPKTTAAFTYRVQDARGADLGRFVAMRTLEGWSLLDDAVDTWIWWGKAHQELKALFAGSALRLHEPLGDDERSQVLGDLLLAASTDVCIGLRAYSPMMR